MSSQFVLKPLFNRTVKSVLGASFVDFWAAELGSDQRVERTIARVVARWMETADTVTLVLQPNSNFPGFQAGQHINLTVEVDGVRHTRSYSFSEAPSSAGLIAITVKRVPGGRVSNHLVDSVQVGDRLELASPFGDMVLPALKGDEKFLFLAAGSGITPLMSMIRELAKQGMPADVVLMYWARSREDLIFGKELQELAARHPRLRVQPVVEQAPAEPAGELLGRPSQEQFTATVADLSERAVFVCGPTGFMKAVAAICEEKAAAFHAEAFTPPVFVPTETAAMVKLTLSKSRREITVPGGMPLLDALEAQGIKPRSGCRMGICNTCACGKSGGVTRNLLDNSVSVDDTASLRICVSVAVGDLTLDL